MGRTCVLTTILGLALSSAAFGQVTAGCGEIGICGTTNGASGSGANGSGSGSEGMVNGFYLQYAQQWNLKAAQCQNPVGAACARSYATWNNCMAYNSNNTSCGNKPVCVASCSTSGAGGGVTSFSSGNAKVAQVDSLISAGFQLFSLFHKDSPAPQPDNSDESDPEPDPAAAAAAQQQMFNDEATNLLASANSLLPSLSGASPGTPAPPDSNAALSALLDDGTPSNTSTAAINSLLGDSQGAGAGPATNAVNNLLAENDTPATNTTQPGDPFYQPPPATSVPYNGPFPDNEITIDWGDSQDQPDPTMFDTLKQNLQAMAQGVQQKVSDVLAPVIDQTKQAINYTQQQIAPFVNDPDIQKVSQVVSGGGTSMPLTSPTDSVTTFDRNVTGQATAGGVNLVKGPSGLGTYMNGNVNQINAGLGWADTQITGTNGGAKR
jgi:hypothetical protein